MKARYFLDGKEISEKQAIEIEALNKAYMSSNDMNDWLKCQFITKVNDIRDWIPEPNFN
ncbi:hypothetical protein [Dysgonomonas termitidis]|uniref:Uncharacterized protein n=1 Tax=Dysgonomonas termitidis TaxID=1516126 RepID=A0ABV9KPJ3_9BACT